jgi:hypothetical protein
MSGRKCDPVHLGGQWAVGVRGCGGAGYDTIRVHAGILGPYGRRSGRSPEFRRTP